MKVHLQQKKDYWDKNVKLSDRIRPNSEAAPWVIDEVKKLEERLSTAEAMLKGPTKLLLIPELMKQAGWRRCAKGQKTTQHCGMAEQARADEREACAKICEKMAARCNDIRKAALEVAAENIRGGTNELR